MCHPHTCRTIYSSPTVQVDDYQCRPESEGPSDGAVDSRPVIVFLRSGLFRKHAYTAGELHPDVVADPGHVVFFNAGESYRTFHPVPGGDDCTVFFVQPSVLARKVARLDPVGVSDPMRPFRFTHASTDPETDLIHHCRTCIPSGESGNRAALSQS